MANVTTKKHIMPEINFLNTPHISVLLPVYNGAKYLKDAIESILNQTYSDFELIIINDGSQDNSVSIIERFNDTRIRFFCQPNMGLAATLNRAIGLANGIYLARQDQDDYSLPTRFEKQVSFLDLHPNCGIVGCLAQIWKEDIKTRQSFKHSTDNLSLKFDLLFNNPFVHSSIMIRKEILNKIGNYSTNTDRQPPEDYELWSRVSRKYEVANIPDVLHIYREAKDSMSRTGIHPFIGNVVKISSENLCFVFGRSIPDFELTQLSALVNGEYEKVSFPPNLWRMSSLICCAAQRLIDLYSFRHYMFFYRVFACLLKLYCRFLIYLCFRFVKWAKTFQSSRGV